MGREVRRVPKDWHHPKDEYTGRYQPMYEGQDYERRLADFMAKLNSDGMQEAIDWCGPPPDKNEYMPNWPESERTHYMMYEDTSEGTPISPAFASPEELAQWLVDNHASAFGSQTATYEGWLRVCQGGFAPSMVMTGGKLMSGVDAL